MNRPAIKEATAYKLLAGRMREKKSLLTLIAVSFLGTVAIYASSKGADWINALAPVFVVLSVVLIAAAFRNWQFGIQALLVIVIIEGAVRKWFLPSATELIYFYKDLLMGVILL